MMRQARCRPLRRLDEHVIGTCAASLHSERQTWGGSDSKRCFFGDFLCTSKESYPLAEGQWKPWLSKKTTRWPKDSGSSGSHTQKKELDSGLRRNDERRVTRWPKDSGSSGFPRRLGAGRRTVEALALTRERKNWIPAFAGMTSGELPAGRRTVEALALTRKRKNWIPACGGL